MLRTSFTTIDGGGSNPGEIAAYYFETGLDGWTDGGNDCARVASSNSYEGSYSIRLRDGSSTSNAVSPNIDLTGNTQVSIEFHTYANSMENGESYVVEFYNGSAYQVVGQYFSGTDFSNGAFFDGSITLNATSYNFATNNRLRFRNIANSNNDQIYFDQVIVTGDNAAPFMDPAIDDMNAVKTFASAASENIRLYPNPTLNQLTIEILEGTFDTITVYAATGTIVKSVDPSMENMTIDVSRLASGMYFVKFVSEGLAVTKRFIKE
jgi:hypothetical protein